MIRVLLVDDHPVVRAGYARFLEQAGGISVVAEAGCATSGYIAYLQHQPDVTISDISMPTVGGLELLRKIKQRDAGAKVLMCSMYDGRNLVRSALEGGAIGFVTKNSTPENLVTGVKSAFLGQPYLSDDLAILAFDQTPDEESQRIAQLTLRELEIWRLLAQGCTPADCAERLNISLKTVANNQTQIKEKLAVSNTAALVHLAQRHQLIQTVVN
ncbi:DNA-binding response regulator [Limnohabitans sp. TS-CS-82]|jgi:DNA-binding NarL/FixJ family response regulator|uniref:response regulator n=1 Tax=Limnohabitans sp. TS-CS-82 TaxID=2094193 RepID=UPI000CF2AEAA|nr:response regulator transcription factor [Limnohabitans sp. TS-CS-82]PQA83689.1 DNA-binding response regulator [Limnohabitans sp. TS-CS-82]